MKHLNKLIVAIMVVMGFSSHAQDRNNPWAISAGVNAVDTRTSALEDKNHFDSFFKVKENWNVWPSAYVGVSRYIGSNFSVGLQGSFNEISKFAIDDAPNDGVVVVNPGDLKYYAFDANLKYSFMDVIKSKVIDPSLHLGGGYVFMGDKTSFPSINGGAGLTFWITEKLGLSLASTYKKVYRTSNVLQASHFQHTAGITYKFGGKDTDGDKIYDKFDACPEVPGLKEFNGCPDTDGDGVIDSEDTCPEVAGPKELGGCPDTDGDGVLDKDDACPDAAGPLKGCPDGDNDGVADKDDKCPGVAGPAENDGCPWPDADGDGTPDKDDKCPEAAGPADSDGCPELTDEAIFGVKSQARFIYFNFESATLATGDTPKRIETMAFVLKNYANNEFIVEGHTDSTGSREVNQRLSQKRAEAVRDALIKSGFPAENITAIGYGETKPIASNKTKEGRAQNRRTEIKLKK